MNIQANECNGQVYQSQAVGIYFHFFHEIILFIYFTPYKEYCLSIRISIT